MRIFLIPLSITFLNPKILGFHFSTKKSLALGEKCEKLNFKNSLRNLLDKLRRLYMHEWNDHLEIFSCPQVIENSSQHLFLRTDILQKKVVGCPCFSLTIVEKNNSLYFATIKSERVKFQILNLEEFHYNDWKCWMFYPRRVDESDVPSKQQSSSQDSRDSHSNPRAHLLLKCL